jgi:undecaprenyl-diphosphatase
MEAGILHAIHAHAGPVLDRLFLLSADLGTFWFCAPLVLAMAFWHLRRGETAEARLWILAGLSTFLVQEVLKLLAQRARPELWPRLVSPASYSFPSGHALSTATLFPLLAYDLTRARPRAVRVAALAVACALSLFVGFGRLYLGVHWPSDVLAGWAMGAAQAAGLQDVRLVRQKFSGPGWSCRSASACRMVRWSVRATSRLSEGR